MTNSLISLLIIFLLATLCVSCVDDAAITEADVVVDGNAAIIRNPIAPVGAGGTEDTVAVAKLTFEETEHQFGEIKSGETVSHDFVFTNTGRVPLIITTAHATCGCTVPSYPEQPVAPGAKGKISVTFDSKNKYGLQKKPITLIANTYPSATTIYVVGTVVE